MLNFSLTSRKRFVRLVTISTIAVALPALFSTHVFATPGDLSALQVQKLKRVGVSIAVPTYLPKGFKVANVTTNPCPSSAKRDAKGVCSTRSGYTVLYRTPNNTCLAVYGEFTRGIGGGAGEFAYPTRTKLFGEVLIGFGNGRSLRGEPTLPQQLSKPQPNLSSFPVYQPGTAIIYGVQTLENQDGCTTNRSITPLEMEKILQSLVWLEE